MKYERYPVEASEDLYMYDFYSEGLKGRIKKKIIFSCIEENLFNLGFGDWNEKLQELDDSSRSNNGDRDQVLATVAFTTLDFIARFPDARIYVEGSTPARTRLYQMGIGDNFMEINEKFDVKGLLNGLWESFLHGRNYDAFLIKRK